MASTYTIDSDGAAFTLAAVGDEGVIHIHAIEEVADLEIALLTGNYPTRMVLEYVATDDIFERGPIGGEKEIGLYIEHLATFWTIAVLAGGRRQSMHRFVIDSWSCSMFRRKVLSNDRQHHFDFDIISPNCEVVNG